MPRVYVVDNAGDDLAAVRQINAYGGPAEHRAVLRPTRGPGDGLATGWDLLVAARKPPNAARREHVSALSWEYGQAWLAGLGVTNLVVDRAHLLTSDQVDAARPPPEGPALPCGCCGASASTRTLPATTARRIWWPGRALRSSPCGSSTSVCPPPRRRPRNQTSLASGRRCPLRTSPPSWRRAAATGPRRVRLGRAPVLRHRRGYRRLAGRLRRCPRLARRPDHRRVRGGADRLAARQRDRPGAVRPSPWSGCARCRPRCSSARSRCPGGPARSARSPPPGNLAPQVAGALLTAVRTYAAAATALSVHLNQGLAFFGALQLSDIAPDGSAIRVPAGRPGPPARQLAGRGRLVRPGARGCRVRRPAFRRDAGEPREVW